MNGFLYVLRARVFLLILGASRPSEERDEKQDCAHQGELASVTAVAAPRRSRSNQGRSKNARSSSAHSLCCAARFVEKVDAVAKRGQAREHSARVLCAFDEADSSDSVRFCANTVTS